MPRPSSEASPGRWLDLARGLERLPSIARDDLRLPVLGLQLVDELLAWDHARGVVLAIAPTQQGIRRLQAQHASACAVARLDRAGGELAAISYETYRPLAERVLAHIAAGDIYQANLTHRLSATCSAPVELYARLRESAPVPYNLYLDGGTFQLAGASPETFLRIAPDGTVETRPIKGTAPRSDDPDEDAALAAGLAASAKDRAENTMIVDLARNDLGRVCAPGSVRFPQLCAVESHPTVHQLVSTVRGRLGPASGCSTRSQQPSRPAR